MDREALEYKYEVLRIKLERAKDDPLLNYELFPKQKLFTDAVLFGDKDENWLCCANRFGKSCAGAYCGSHLARLGTPENPGVPTSGWVVAIDNNVMRETIQPKYFDNGYWLPNDSPPFIPAREIAHWSEKKQTLKLVNGSIIGFKSLAAETCSLYGAGKDWVQFDEEPNKNAYDEIGIRLAAGRRLRIFGTCTLLPPEGAIGGVSWIFTEIIKKIKKLPHIGLYGGSLYDNPHISEIERSKVERRYPPGTLMHRIRILGELLPGVAGSRAYTHFKRDTHVKPLGDIALNIPLMWTWDFNIDPMVSIVMQRINNVYKVHRVFKLSDANIDAMVDEFKAYYPDHSAGVWIYGDWTGRRREQQSNRTNFDLIMSRMISYPGECTLKVPHQNPHIIARKNAVNNTLVDEDGRIGLEINEEDCEALIVDLEDVLLSQDGRIKKSSNKADPYYWLTHPSDALGYLLSMERPVEEARRSKSRLRGMRSPSYSSN